MAGGVLDSALASLATFEIGYVAVRYLDPIVLGGYALCFRALFLAGNFPSQLIYTPIEAKVVDFHQIDRLNLLVRTTRRGLLPAILSALAVSLWIFAVPDTVPSPAVWALTITAIPSAFLSPVQDHVRRMLHSGGATWWAVGVSTIQVCIVTGYILIFLEFELDIVWIPFGALAAANLISLLFGVGVASWVSRHRTLDVKFSLKKLLRPGSWLLATGLITGLGAFLVGVLVARLASIEALGYAEGARVVSQPLIVLALGLTWVLGPRSMEAARRQRREKALHISRMYRWVLGVIAVGYLMVFGLEWNLNPFHVLLPNAYEIAGLVAAMILANLVFLWPQPERRELIGVERTVNLTKVEAVGNVIRTAIGATAGQIGAFAVPGGLFALGIARWFGYRTGLRAHYHRNHGDANKMVG